MKLKEVLDQSDVYKNVMIEVRCNSPLQEEDDMLFGWCIYDPDKQSIIMSDNDDYSLDMEIDRYETVDGRLIVWFGAGWLSGWELKRVLNNKSVILSGSNTTEEGESV